MKISVSAAFSRVQSVSLPGRRSFRVRTSGQRPCLLAPQTLLDPLDDPLQQIVGLRGIAGQPVVEVVPHRRLDQARRLGVGELLLGLALELRLAQEHRELRRIGPSRSSAVTCAALRLPLCSP